MAKTTMDFDREGRLRFARVTGRTAGVLQAIGTCLEPSLPAILDAFYEHLRKDTRTSQILGTRAGRLKQAQAAHWRRLFAGTFDQTYMEGVFHIGLVHQKIGLQPRWYIAGYQVILNAMILALSKGGRNRKELSEWIEALTQAVFLDMDLAVTAYHHVLEQDKVDQMGAVARQVVGEIGAGLDEVNDFVLHQCASATETKATTESILKNLKDLNTLIVEQAANVSQTSSSIEEMIANTASVAKAIDFIDEAFNRLEVSSEDGRRKISHVVETINRVAELSEKLQEANTVIDSIAAQTNLLAMNAAIEAAHAGTAGKGFSVVAGEIRKLAEMSTRQSREISGNIRTIRDDIRAVAGASAVASDAFGGILGQIAPLADSVDRIQAALKEQGEGSRQVLEATAQINRITSDVRDGSVEMLQGSQVIGAEMDRLLSASEKVRTKTADLLVKTRTIPDEILRIHSAGT